ncbi:GNAT family N-acetyltransferase [Fodinicola feengrottensis]|nr:GNAT family N-acyltransferase [Fodinicola feengrottensis]
MLYSDGEFDLTALEKCRPALIEAGRSCVHPDHRNGAVIGLLWAGIARYLVTSGGRWLAGCASVSLDDGGLLAAGVWGTAREMHLSDPELRVTPHHRWKVGAGVPPLSNAGLPPLLRGYLRLGAKVCGPPAYDPDFHTADFFVLLDIEEANPRYLRRLVDGLR